MAEESIKHCYDIMKTLADTEIGEARHIKELKERIRACTRDEMIAISDVIAQKYPDILFDSLLKEMLHKESIIEKMRGAIDG